MSGRSRTSRPRSVPGIPRVATVLHNLGGLAHAAGRPGAGEAAARRAVDIRELRSEATIPTPPQTRLRCALAIKQQWLGPDHLELVPTLGTLGVIRRRRGNPVDARRLYERALKLLDGRVVADHPHVAALEANLAALADEAEGGGGGS
jgi:hypothetical protein